MIISCCNFKALNFWDGALVSERKLRIFYKIFKKGGCIENVGTGFKKD